MTVDRGYCMSSYLVIRYVFDSEKVFKDEMKHRECELPIKSEQVPCASAEDIDSAIRESLGSLNLNKTGVLLSGGMDSAILASQMPPGTKAYTSRCVGTDAVDETPMAKKYCDTYDLEHIIVDVSWEDYRNSLEALMKYDGQPVAPNEPQVYHMAKRAKEDGLDTLLIGNFADIEFGGMDRLLSKDWKYDEFIERYQFVSPKEVLKNPVDVYDDIFGGYKTENEGIDFIKFVKEPYAISSGGAYINGIECVGLKPFDPFTKTTLEGTLDLTRVRNGESKYLIRDLFSMRYPEISVPEKKPMSRPMESWMKDWSGPRRDEFIPGCVDRLNGEQRFLVYCLERFLDMIGE